MNHNVCFLPALLAALPGCIGTTGSDLLTFDADAAGPTDAQVGMSFEASHGFHVTLTRAKLHIGAVYLSRAKALPGAQDTGCILPGIYVAQVTQGLDVDLLSPAPQRFPAKGEGTSEQAQTGEVWLTFGDVNAVNDNPPPGQYILDIAGTATKDGASYPFEGHITIGENRAQPVTDPALPSEHPICKERIVSPIDVDITPWNGGNLLLRVDPRGFFTNVDFSQLKQVSTSPPSYAFEDSTTGQPNINLYRNLKANRNSGVYQFSWVQP